MDDRACEQPPFGSDVFTKDKHTGQFRAVLGSNMVWSMNFPKRITLNAKLGMKQVFSVCSPRKHLCWRFLSDSIGNSHLFRSKIFLMLRIVKQCFTLLMDIIIPCSSQRITLYRFFQIFACYLEYLKISQN